MLKGRTLNINKKMKHHIRQGDDIITIERATARRCKEHFQNRRENILVVLISAFAMVGAIATWSLFFECVKNYAAR